MPTSTGGGPFGYWIGALRRRRADWRNWILPGGTLAVFIVAFAAIMYEVALTSYANITPGGVGGATDLSIMIQALSATGHGYLPFYESPDCVHTARCSLLLVHPALTLYVLVPFFALDPTPSFLFALQAAGVALAAVPLYWLATELSGSRWKGVVAGGVYLIFLPTISSIDFSFHVEPFLPLELFTLFWLWRGRHYYLGLALAVVAIFTFDVNSVLIFFFGVFFLWPFLVRAGTDLLEHARAAASGSQIGATLKRQLTALFRAPSAAPARAALVLMVVCVAGYLFLRLFVEHSTWFGLPALPARFMLPVSRPNPQFQLTPVFGGSLSNWLMYWVLAFGLLGFIGFLVPRTLWLALPWAAYTAFASSPNYTTLGLHYGAIVAVPLLIGFAYGLAKLPLGGMPATARTPRPRAVFHVERAVAYSVLAVVIGVNLALTPLGPLASPLANSEFPVYAQYPSTLQKQPGSAELEALGQLVPQYSTLLAPYLLMPYVARDVYAYPYPPGTTKNLPFPVPALPQYVLTDPADVSSLPGNVQNAIYNPNDYGAVGVVPITAIGMVTLFERGWSGSAQVFGPTPAASWSYTPNQLRVTGNGTGLVHASGTPNGVALEAKNTSIAGQLLFSTPGLSVVPGSYTAVIELWVDATTTGSGSNPKFLSINVTGFSGPDLLTKSLLYASYPSSGWFSLTVNVTATEPTYDLQVTGVLLTSHTSEYLVMCGGLTLDGSS